MSIFASANATLEGLRSVGYQTTEQVATAIFSASKLGRPMLLEGPAGAGKTEMALSVAKAEKMPFIRLQCYAGIGDKEAIGHYNSALQDLFARTQTAAPGGASWDMLKAELLSRKFFSAGPLLEAIESETRCVLLIDEIDKVDYSFEAMLLELLSVWEMSIPGMGTIKAKHAPFTVITSNKERELGYALRRRSFFLEIEHPTPELEARIIAMKTPSCSTELHDFIAGLAKAMRSYSMEKPPSISEMSDLARVLELLGKTTIDPADKMLLLPMIAKTSRDLQRLMLPSGFDDLVRTAGRLTLRHREERNTASAHVGVQ